MNKFIFSLLLLSLLPLSGYSQKVYKKISKDACECLEKQPISSDNKAIQKQLENCLERSILANLNAISKSGIDLEGNSDEARKFGEKIAMELVKNCDRFKQIMLLSIASQGSPSNNNSEDENTEDEETPDLLFDEDVIKTSPNDSLALATPVCSSLANGSYTFDSYLVHHNEVRHEDPSAYFSLTGTTYTEYHDNGKYLTRATVNKKNDCEFILTVEENTYPLTKDLLKKGSTFTLRIGKTPEAKALPSLIYIYPELTFTTLIKPKE